MYAPESSEYAPEGLPRHFVSGDLIMSHVVSMLSSVFPPGEDFFVQSVRNYRDRITDPELKKQVAAFIGQEAMHSREHDRFNARLDELGYRTRLLDRIVDIGLNKVGAKILPKKVQLAITAALEHYTATLAEIFHPHRGHAGRYRRLPGWRGVGGRRVAPSRSRDMEAGTLAQEPASASQQPLRESAGSAGSPGLQPQGLPPRRPRQQGIDGALASRVLLCRRHTHAPPGRGGCRLGGVTVRIDRGRIRHCAKSRE